MIFFCRIPAIHIYWGGVRWSAFPVFPGNMFNFLGSFSGFPQLLKDFSKVFSGFQFSGFPWLENGFFRFPGDFFFPDFRRVFCLFPVFHHFFRAFQPFRHIFYPPCILYGRSIPQGELMYTCKVGVTHQYVLKWGIFKRWGPYVQSCLWGFNMEKLKLSQNPR